MNGATLAARVRGSPLLQRLAQSAPAAAVETLYWRLYSRAPAPEELERLLGAAAVATATQPFLEDVAWALLNSREFLFSH